MITGLIITVISVGLFSIVTGPAAWLLAIMAGAFRDMIWAVSGTMIVETEGIGPVYAGTAVGMVHAMARVGYTFAPPAGNSLESVYSGLPFVFWAALSLMALVVFLFAAETGWGRRTNPSPAD
jgi:hypothetical protein